MLGDGNGAFIVRTVAHKLYRLAFGTGYVEIPTQLRVPGGSMEQMQMINNMFFDKGCLIVVGSISREGIDMGCCAVYDPDYEYAGSVYDSPAEESI